MPMGSTPGFLSSAIRRHDINGVKASGSTKSLQRRLVRRARQWQRSSEVFLKEEHNLLQPCASLPEGPAAPLVWSAAERMVLPMMLSKMTGITIEGTCAPS